MAQHWSSAESRLAALHASRTWLVYLVTWLVYWVTDTGQLTQKAVMPLAFQELHWLVTAEKVKPSVFLLVGVRKGIQPVKLYTKHHVKLSRGSRLT